MADVATRNEITDYAFSPDSDWITYAKESSNGQGAVWVHQISTGKNYPLTDDTFSDSSPVFSTDGNFIFFLSNRDFNLDFSSFEFNYLYNKATKIFAIALKGDGPKLFPLKNDVEEVKEEPKTFEPKKIEERRSQTRSKTESIN